MRVPTLLAASAALLLSSPLLAQDLRFQTQQLANWPFLQQSVQATALVTFNDALHTTADGLALYTRPLGERYELCADQKFTQEASVVGACTGFLAGPDVFITAPSCIKGPADCARKSIIFGTNDPSAPIKAEQVYTCKHVTGNLSGYLYGKYTIVRLDRPVAGVTPLTIAAQNAADLGQSVAMLGHPQGLALKASTSRVFTSEENFHNFQAGLAAFAGSEGSPVIDWQSGQVLGLQQSNLNNDITFNRFRGCAETNICHGEACFLERLTHASVFKATVTRWNQDAQADTIE